MRADYDQSGIAFDSAAARIARLEENIDILQGLFAEGQCSFAGRHYSVTGLDGSPKPVQPGGPPIIIGGGGRKILSMAARRADIVQVLGASFGTRGAVVDDCPASASRLSNSGSSGSLRPPGIDSVRSSCR